MKAFALSLALALSPLAVMAEDVPPPTADEDQFGLFGETMRGFMEDLAGRMAPALRDMEDQLGPALEALGEQLGRLDAYHPPEVLPNGDIIIRRKQEDEKDTPQVITPESEAIEL